LIAAQVAMTSLAQHRSESPPTVSRLPQKEGADSIAARERLHMKMTVLREPSGGDKERADEMVATARKGLSKYVDYRLAEKDGYHIARTPMCRRIYHFTNYSVQRATNLGAQLNPEQPTSLIYEKQGNGYKLIAAMYTAPATASEEDLDRRVPLSVAQWHIHANVCMPRRDQMQRLWESYPDFGEIGRIHSKEECELAAGRFLPFLNGWMIHLYLFEKDPAEIWSAHREMEEESGPPIRCY
jgi:hypothetical protein